jgi:hypothetical protein
MISYLQAAASAKDAVAIARSAYSLVAAGVTHRRGAQMVDHV